MADDGKTALRSALDLLRLIFSFSPRPRNPESENKDGGHGSIFRQEEEEGQEEGLQRQPGGHRGGHQQHARVSGLACFFVLGFDS